jgi:hypothetical protein
MTTSAKVTGMALLAIGVLMGLIIMNLGRILGEVPMPEGWYDKALSSDKPLGRILAKRYPGADLGS